jgi:hypothetical protein
VLSGAVKRRRAPHWLASGRTCFSPGSLASCPWPAPSGADECCPIYYGTMAFKIRRTHAKMEFGEPFDKGMLSLPSAHGRTVVPSEHALGVQHLSISASQPYPSSKVRFCHRVLRNPSGWETLARLNRGSQKSHHGRSFQPHASSPATCHPLPTRSFMPELSQVTPPLF